MPAMMRTGALSSNHQCFVQCFILFGGSKTHSKLIEQPRSIFHKYFGREVVDNITHKHATLGPAFQGKS